MSREFLRFDPTLCPTEIEDIPRFLDNMFLEIRTVLDLVRDGHLDVTNVEPTNPYQGDITSIVSTSPLCINACVCPCGLPVPNPAPALSSEPPPSSSCATFSSSVCSPSKKLAAFLQA